ncbi:MAG: hypothetical protein R6W77_09585 [Trueperaceae bacterium]
MRVPFLLPFVTAVVLTLAGGFPGSPAVANAQAGAAVAEAEAGWEALLVDPAGLRLLGHGRSDAGTLVLELGASVRGFVLLLVGPEGTLERFDGYVGDDGTLMVSTEVSDTPTMEALETLLGRRGLALVVVHVSDDRDDGPAGHDDEDGAPGDVPGDDSGDEPDDGDDRDDGDDGDDGDQDPSDDSDPSDDGDDADDGDDDEGDDGDDADDGDDGDSDDDRDGDDDDDATGDDATDDDDDD